MCFPAPPIYIPHSNVGITAAISNSEGRTINVGWYRAYPRPYTNIIAYNIYFSTDPETVFSEGPKYISINSDTYAVEIGEFTPGDVYHFAVRATQFQPGWIDLNSLPDSGDSKVYPEGILLAPMTETSNSLMVSDINIFPNYGILQIGTEVITYSNRDIPSSTLSGLVRGVLDTNIRIHETDGYDGYYQQDPFVRIFKGIEDDNLKYFQETCDFDYPNFAVNDIDGYHGREEDLLNSSFNEHEEDFVEVPPFNNSGWRRFNPADILRGACLGSYQFGEEGCVDGYLGRTRGNGGVNEGIIRREELLLEASGLPCVLVKRKWTGIHCSCYTSTTEYPEASCPICLGTGFVIGWEQYFNPRRSDGRIMVRFDPTQDDVPYLNAGLESQYNPSAWTLSIPIINDRDMLIVYGRGSNAHQENWRYEIVNVTRNILFLEVQGAQKMTLNRVRKTDPFYKFNVIDSTATMPRIITTSLSSVPGLILPHSHTIHINENTISLNQINQVTSYNGVNTIQEHSHQVINGIIQVSLNHTHNLII